MIKDGFGQGYLFDNHWSATVMDGGEDLCFSLLPPHNHGSLLWSPPPNHFLWPCSRSPLTFKEKYQIELKLLAHPKQSAVRLKNHTSVPTIHCCKVSSSLSLAFSLSLWVCGNVNYSCQRGLGMLHHVKVPMTLLMEPLTPTQRTDANVFGRRKEKSWQHL